MAYRMLEELQNRRKEKVAIFLTFENIVGLIIVFFPVFLGEVVPFRILWRLPWTKEAIRFYQALEQRHLRAATYLMITWEPPDVSAQSLLTTLRHAFRLPVERLDYLPTDYGQGKRVISVWHFANKTWCYATDLTASNTGWRVAQWGQIARCP